MRFKLVLILATVIVFGFACELGNKIQQGNAVAAKIEKFKTDKGKLPDSLSEIGIEEKLEGPIYYKKESETKYILWFGKELGESMTYDSGTKIWK